MPKTIYVYENWSGDTPVKLGEAHCQLCRHNAAADRENSGHQFHAATDRHLCQHEANKMPQGKFRPLQFRKGRCRGKDADSKKQYRQTVADTHKGRIDVGYHTPYLPALKGFRCLCNQRP